MSEILAGLGPEHPEFCTSAEIDEQAKQASFELKRKFFDDCSTLRADYVGMLTKHNALRRIGGWALFLLDEDDSDAGSLAIVGVNEILVIIGTGCENHRDPLDVADIRVVTNQRFRTINGGLSYATRDFTLDESNLCQYMPGMFVINEDGSFSGANYVPIFYFDGGKMHTRNLNPITRSVSAISVDQDNVTHKTTPFGHHSNIEDAFYALRAGQELLDLVVDAEPVAHSVH